MDGDLIMSKGTGGSSLNNMWIRLFLTWLLGSIGTHAIIKMVSSATTRTAIGRE